jgi:hypothetical protein
MKTRLLPLLMCCTLPLFAPPARATLLWDGDASKGTGVFKDLHLVHGDVGIVTEPVGKAFRFRVWNVDDGSSSDRSEGSHAGNLTMENNRTYYFGWKQKYGNPLPNPSSTDWVGVFQWKANPAQGGFNYPIVIRADSNNLRVLKQNISDGSVSTVWQLGSLPVNQWVSWVLAIRTSEDPKVGYVEIWYNGTRRAKHYMQTYKSGSRVDPKWGTYRSTRIEPDASTYLWRPRCGTTYADVAP